MVKQRIEALAKSLSKRQCALIIEPMNRRYFTNFPSSAGMLFISKEKSIFYTDSRYVHAAKQSIPQDVIVRMQDADTQIANIVHELGCKTVSVEAEYLSFTRAKELERKLGDSHLSIDLSGEIDSLISYLRSVKESEEVEYIVFAQRLAEKAFAHILSYIKEGRTEKEIALELDYTMLKLGSEGVSFETIIASGENGAKPHAIPSDRKVKQGDFITMDFGAVINGYHSDMTRTVALGQITQEQQKVYDTVLIAQKNCIANIRAGIKAQQADALTRDIIDNAGYKDFFGHATGHSLGLDIHEKPSLSSQNQKVLLENQVVTVEPGIYLPDKFGVRIEDMVWLKDNGAINLTKAEKELIIL